MQTPADMLIDNIADFKRFVKVAAGFQTLGELQPWIERAEAEYIEPAIGAQVLADLQEAYDDSASDDATNEVLEAAQRALCLFAYYTAIPAIEVKMYETGLHALSDEKYKSANDRQSGDYREAYHDAAYSALETLYKKLIEHAGTFEEWRASDGYAQHTSSIIRSAHEFNAAYRINNSHVTFVDLKPAIDRAQTLILRKELGEDFYDSLIDHVSGDDSSDSDAADADMMDLAVKKLRPALAHFAIGHAQEVLFRNVNGALISTRYNGNSRNDVKVIDDRLHSEFATDLRTKAMNMGHSLLAVTRQWLDAHASDFPLYLNGPGYRENGVDERTEDDRMHNTSGMTMV